MSDETPQLHDMENCVLNHGMLLGMRPKDYIVGVNSPLSFEERNPSGIWDQWLPPGEWQRNNFFDTYACVTFSALNCLETQVYFLTGRRINFSDRFTAKMSGTIPGVGNYLWKVAESIRNDGVLFEEDWPAPDNYNEATYYAEISQALKDKAKTTFDLLGFEKPTYEWIMSPPNVDELTKHMKHVPVQVVLPGHAIEDRAQYPDKFGYLDSYDPFLKEHVGLPQVGMKIIINKKMATDAMTAKEIEDLQILEGYHDPAGIAYWSNKPLRDYLTARLQDKLKAIQAALQ